MPKHTLLGVPIPDDMLIMRYIPVYEKLEDKKDNPYLQKIGGSQPFFCIGDIWPECKICKTQMTFIFQLKDPKNDSDLVKFYQLFMCLKIDKDHLEKKRLKSFDIRFFYDVYKSSLILPNVDTKILSCYKIKKWKKDEELECITLAMDYVLNYPGSHDIITKFVVENPKIFKSKLAQSLLDSCKLDVMKQVICDGYFNHVDAPIKTFKFYGTGNRITKDDFSNNFVQICKTEFIELDFEGVKNWVLHITNGFNLEIDFE